MGASNDLFISYRRADKPSVEPLLAALRARGVRVWQDERDVEDLAGIQHAVGTGLSGARALLAWYSSRYNESRACQWELTAAYCAARAEGDPRQRILVVNPEPGNAHVHLPELVDQLHFSGQGVPDDVRAVDSLADRIHAALRDTVPATPLGELRSLTPPRWLPSMGTGSTRFVGRLREMWQLHGQLLAGQAAMLTGTGGKPGLALVRGAGGIGIGKSLMAEEYALQERVLEIRKRVLGDEHPDTLMSMNNLASTLGRQGDLPGARRLQEVAVSVGRRVLGDEHSSTLRWMHNLAGILWQQGESPNARRLQEMAVQGLLRTLGPTHPHTQQSVQNLTQMAGNVRTGGAD